ncbi:oligosaccharide flippase family protein [Candidatus Roizmanbacteria bacterium]|nr:oligosaccharide flippase family protein [Candidatus Roizmanbacteria bacterium]
MGKVAFVTNYYKESEKKELERVEKEIRKMGFAKEKIYATDSTKDNRGYVYGLNKGIKKAVADGAEIFITFNPDISLEGVKKENLLHGLEKFDVLGFCQRQNGKIYYGGSLDRWRLSGSLNEKKPKSRFSGVDFVSGSFLVFKKKVLDAVGYFDESYFLFYDEVDFCHRAKKKGFNIGVDSGVTYDHFEFSQRNLRKEYFLAKSRFKFFIKYASFAQKARELIRLPKTFFEYLPLIKNIFLNSRFLVNFFSLNLSSVLVKLLYFLLFILLIRYLSPEQYGVYNVVWAHVALLSPLMDFGTTSYSIVYLPREETKKFNSLFSLRFFLSFIVFIATMVLAWIWSYDLPTKKYIYLTSVVIFSNMFSGSFLILNSLREKVYLSSIVSFVFNLILVFAYIMALTLNQGLNGVFVLVFIFYGLYALSNLMLIKGTLKTDFQLVFSPSTWLQVMKKSYVFVLISLFAGLYFKLDVFLLNFIKGPKAVGIYSAGYKFLDALMFMVGSYNISATPILSKLSEGNPSRLVRKIKKDIILLIAVSFPLVLGMQLLGPYLLPRLIRNFYPPSVGVAKTVIFALPLILISSVFINTLYVLNKTKWVIFVFLFQVVFTLAANLIFIPKFSFMASAYITVVSEIVNAISFYILLRRSI